MTKDSTMINIRIRNADLEVLKALASADERTVNSLVRSVLRKLIDDHKAAQA